MRGWKNGCYFIDHSALWFRDDVEHQLYYDDIHHHCWDLTNALAAELHQIPAARFHSLMVSLKPEECRISKQQINAHSFGIKCHVNQIHGFNGCSLLVLLK